MRICLVEQGDRFPTERILKTADSLTGDGHRIFLLCNNYGSQTPSEEDCGSVHVIRLGPTFKNRKLNRLLKFPLFVNPLWLWQLSRAVRRHSIDAIHVIDVPLAPAALAVARVSRIPVVLDMWENYPEALRIWGQNDWHTLVFKNYVVARWVERWVVKRVDHIITVVEEQRDRLVGEGVPAEQISVVTNGVDAKFLCEPEPQAFSIKAAPDRFKMLYVGCLTIERGLDDIINAVALLKERLPQVQFWIAGTGDDQPRLQRLAQDLGVSGQIDFLGWVDHSAIPALITKSDLCVVPHLYCPFINTTIPNKLFQYMALAKPVLVSNARPLARIVDACRCGLVFESRNPESAASKIMEAYGAAGKSDMGARGKAEVQRLYTWEKAAGPLLWIYRRLASSRATSA